MEYNKSRVYTALNADELKPGSKVIVADDVTTLELRVKDGTDIRTLTGINAPSELARFIAGCHDAVSNTWALAYLVEQPEKPTVTYRELACWLAQGNGQCMAVRTRVVGTDYKYELGEENNLVSLTMKVRRWDDNEWHIATKEYLEGDK